MRRHLTTGQRAMTAAALGVRGSGSHKRLEESLSNNTATPSQQDHADALGVSRPTVARWEKDRKQIKADPELAEKDKKGEMTLLETSPKFGKLLQVQATNSSGD